MTKLENKYIALLWWAIFMLVLPWDQKKIVVVNLIIFCYFLYYMISASVEETFEQRKNTIRHLLVQGISAKLSLFSVLIREVRVFANLYEILVLRLISQTKVATFLSRGVANTLVSKTLFSAIALNLETLSQSDLNSQLSKNLVSTHILLKSIKPSVSGALDLEE